MPVSMTPDELQAYAQHLKSQGFNDDEAKAYLQSQGLSGPDPGLLSQAWSGVKTAGHAALETAGRVMNEARGLSHVALGGLADQGLEAYNQGPGQMFGQIAPNRAGINAEDFQRALKGQGMSDKEIAMKLGVPDNGPKTDLSFKIPLTDMTIGKKDATPLDMVGAVGDTVGDPMMYIGAGEAKLAAQAAEGGLKGLAAKALLKSNQAMNLPMDAVAGTGKQMYKWGLKGIDGVAEMYGKKPVSDLLFNEGITGTKHQILQKMQDLGDQELAARNKILQAGDTAVTGGYGSDLGLQPGDSMSGKLPALSSAGEVSMQDAMKPTRDYIAKLRAENDPTLQKLADQLEEKANAYEQRDRIYANTPIERVADKTSTLDLPLQGGQYTPLKVNPGGPVEMPLPGQAQTRFDYAKGMNVPVEGPAPTVSFNQPPSFERGGPTELAQNSTGPIQILEQGGMQKAGPTIEQNGVLPTVGSGFKTTAAAEVPESQWKNMGYVDSANRGTMAMQAGLRQSTEDAIGRSLGDDAKQALINHNERLGQILTTQDRLRLEAAQASNKDMFTTVDGALVHASPASLATKKMADALKTTWVRTKGGKLMNDIGSSPLLRGAVREGELNLNQSVQDPDSQYNFIRPPGAPSY